MRDDLVKMGSSQNESSGVKYIFKNNKSSRQVSVKSHHPNLSNKRSRLDMLDNSQFTSFPLAPPLETSLQQPNKYADIVKSPHEGNQDSYLKCIESTEDEPIVLVEDYIQQKQLKRKKLSVLDLKNSLKSFETEDLTYSYSSGSPTYLNRVRLILDTKSSSLRQNATSLNSVSTSSTMLTKCIVEEIDDEQSLLGSLSTTGYHSSSASQSTVFSERQSIQSNSSYARSTITTAITEASNSSNEVSGEFSLTPTKPLLKHCVICETPLYEISSHLGSNQSYNEFVCSSCTEKYEMLSKLLDEFDQSVSKLTPIPKDTEVIEEVLYGPALKRQKNSEHGFSVTLINKLQSNLNHNDRNVRGFELNNKSEDLWLAEAKRKLRWRWRINGLLPKFLTNDNNL